MASFPTSLEPGKCCYWEDGPKPGDMDITPCKPFTAQERNESKFWRQPINKHLSQLIDSGITIDDKKVYYVVHIFKHVQSLDLVCNNETELNAYLEKLINEDAKETIRKSSLKTIELCLKDNDKYVKLIMQNAKKRRQYYIIYHLSKRTDETCEIGDWEKGLDNYDVPELNDTINPMQYNVLFNREEIERVNKENIRQLNNDSPPLSDQLSDPSPTSITDIKNTKHIYVSPQTPKSIRVALGLSKKKLDTIKRQLFGLEQLNDKKKIEKKEAEKEKLEERIGHHEEKLKKLELPRGGKTKKYMKRKTNKRKINKRKTKRKH